MRLNLPVYDNLAECRHILIAGMGGGFDIFCGLPIYFELLKQGCDVHLANFSFSDIAGLDRAEKLSPALAGVTADTESFLPYFPEKHLAKWFQEKYHQDITIWCFHSSGTRPLQENYEILVEHLSVDGILLIDGGVDGLLRGDETETGTLIEDAISLFAVSQLRDIPIKIAAFTAFGAERGISYHQILENIAELTHKGGFLGSCSLAPQMESYQSFEEAVLYVQEHPSQDSSVICSSLISAVRGHYGNFHLTKKTEGSRLRISPLMSVYQFFDLEKLVEQNLYLTQLQYTETFLDALKRFMEIRPYLKIRRSQRMGLI